MLSLLYGLSLTSIHDYWKNCSFVYMDHCLQSDVSAFNKLSRFLIHCHSFSFKEQVSLNFMAAVILEPKKIKSVIVSTFSPSICREVMGPDVMILVFCMLSIKPVFFTLFFHLHQETFSFSFAFCHII